MSIFPNINPSLVYDLGTSTIQYGFGGDALPINRVPTCAALLSEEESDFQFGDEWLQRDYKTMIKAIPFVIDGKPSDQQPPPSDILSTFFDWAAFQLNCDTSTTPVLISQPASLCLNPSAMSNWRQQILEKLFDFASHPMVSLQYDSTLACYSTCRDTALVIDYGWSGIRVVPTYQGHPIKQAIKCHPLGGLFMTQMLDDLLQSNQKSIRTIIDPPLPNSLSPITRVVHEHDESQILYCRHRVLDDILQSKLNFGGPISDPYYFMSGHMPIDIEEELGKVAQDVWETNERSPSLQNLVKESLSLIPKNLRQQFYDVVVTGGLSKTMGFKETLTEKVNQVLQEDTKIKVIEPVSKIAQGALAVWCGGSIVASMTDFPEMCISKEQWEESGSNHLEVLEKKCI